MLFLSVTEIEDTGALDSVPTVGRNRCIFPAAKPALNCVFVQQTEPADGGTQFGASCDT
jgi:hypothetical protein